MKVGDLVKMKYEMFWKLRDFHAKVRGYTPEMGIVKSTHAKGVKVVLLSGELKIGLQDEWEVVNERIQ